MLQRNVSWVKKFTSIVSEGQTREALLLFQQLHRTSSKAGAHIFSGVLGSCARLAAIKEGEQTHCLLWKYGFNSDTLLLTSLLDVYSKCSQITEARRLFGEMSQRDVVATNVMIAGLCRCHLTGDAIQLFENMPERDVGSWNALISGLGRKSQGATALFYFGKMRSECDEIDVMTMVSVLSVCADLAALSNGKQVHGLVIQHGFEGCLPIGNATLDMYAKSGCMEDACVCFNKMPFRNVISWTSLIAGYGRHGLGLNALTAFEQMELEGIVPNNLTFLSTIYACSHAGLVPQGWRTFNTMISKYSMTPGMEHYTCMVDLLARAGHFKEALNLIETMPMKPDARLLTAVLSHCCNHHNGNLSKVVGLKLLELEPREAGAYMLLSNFYGRVGDFGGVANVRRLMLNRGVRKEKAYTWIEIHRIVHCFESGDRSHPRYKEIFDYIKNIVEKIKNSGYTADTSVVVQNVDERTKEEILLGHSEKLAIALGLLSTIPGMRLTIVKNLRVCADCHEVTALISKAEGREIVARDSSRFHHFRDGICSCGNYW